MTPKVNSLLSADWLALSTAGFRRELTARLLDYAQTQRWYRAKARPTRDARIVDLIRLDDTSVVVVLSIAYLDGAEDWYLLPVVKADSALPHQIPQALVARLADGADALADGLTSGQTGPALLAMIRDGRPRQGETGVLWGEAAPALAELELPTTMPVKVPPGEQSNSSVIFGDRLILKIYRRLDLEPSPEVELGAFLSTRIPPLAIPRVQGVLHYRSASGQCYAAGIVHEFIRNEGDAWSRMLRTLRTSVDTLSTVPQPSEIEWRLSEAFGSNAATLGERTAELHLALLKAGSDEARDPAFVPLPLTTEDRVDAADRVETMLQRALTLLSRSSASADDRFPDEGRTFLAPEGEPRTHLTEVLQRFREAPLTALKTRVHGDLHLGQILCRGDDFVITDFEGEPGRSADERRAKASPLRDVVGMLRSFDYVVETVFREPDAAKHRHRSTVDAIKSTWTRIVRGAFLRSYFDRVAAAPFLPLLPRAPSESRSHVAPVQLSLMLRFYELERLVYELVYELDNRPDWFDIPLRALSSFSARSGLERA